MLHQNGLKLWDLLQDFDALVKHSEHLLYDVFWRSRVNWNQLIWLEDQVEESTGLQDWLGIKARLGPGPGPGPSGGLGPGSGSGIVSLSNFLCPTANPAALE